MGTVFFLNRRSDALLDEMVALRAELEHVLIPAVDDELFYIVTGRSELGAFIAPYAVHFSEEEFGTYRHLTALQPTPTLRYNSFPACSVYLTQPWWKPRRSVSSHPPQHRPQSGGVEQRRPGGAVEAAVCKAEGPGPRR